MVHFPSATTTISVCAAAMPSGEMPANYAVALLLSVKGSDSGAKQQTQSSATAMVRPSLPACNTPATITRPTVHKAPCAH